MAQARGDINLLAEAMLLAEEHHRGVPDKIGMPYIGHVLRVAGGAARTAPEGQESDAVIVGLLHDVVEDESAGGARISLDDLRVRGFREHIVEAVDAITRRKPPHYPMKESDHDYMSRVLNNPLARAVKTVDAMDNAMEERLARIDDESKQHELRAKYRGYIEILTADSQ